MAEDSGTIVKYIPEESLAENLEDAFGQEGPEPEKPKPLPKDDAEPAEPEDAADDAEEGDAAQEPEPEFVIEVEGQQYTVKGKDQVKELLQKGASYSRNAEAVARARDALIAQSQQSAMAQQFQMAVAQDVMTLRQMDAALDQFNRIDWPKAFDEDFIKASSMKERRDQLKEARAATAYQIDAKAAQYQQGQAQASQQVLYAEAQALAAKVPEMRNREKAPKLQSEIANYLVSTEGFNPSEVASVMDHRMVIVAKKAMEYDRLMKGKDTKAKQVRDAPATVRPGVVGDQHKAEMRGARQKLRALGRQGNHRAQEALVMKAFNRAFKP